MNLTIGVCFIVPATLMDTALVWGYVTFGNTPAVEGVLDRSAVIAIIGYALIGLLRTAIKCT